MLFIPACGDVALNSKRFAAHGEWRDGVGGPPQFGPFGPLIHCVYGFLLRSAFWTVSVVHFPFKYSQPTHKYSDGPRARVENGSSAASEHCLKRKRI